MEVRINNSTSYTKIKFSVTRTVDNDGIDEDLTTNTDFYQIEDIIKLEEIAPVKKYSH